FFLSRSLRTNRHTKQLWIHLLHCILAGAPLFRHQRKRLRLRGTTVRLSVCSDLISSNSFVNRMFSFLSLSFSSNSSAGALQGDEFDEITCSSPELDGDTIGFAFGIADNGCGDGTATVAVVPAGGDAERIFRR
ncbi:hypothetical protein CR513_05080, partial [Mucuna pruriens]